MAQTNRLRRYLFKIPFVLCIICLLYILCQSKDYKTKYQNRPRRFRSYNITSINGTNPILESFKFNPNESDSDLIHLVMFYTHVQDHFRMKEKLFKCLSSLVSFTSSSLHILLITDVASLPSARDIMFEISMKNHNELQVDFYNVDNVVKPLHELISYMQPHFTYKEGAYYSDALFFLSIGIHRIFPYNKLIMIDIDIKFISDIKELYSHFEKFGPNAVIGIAQEQQPVYRHLLHGYRRIHPQTKVGSPSPDGFPGFNSGVLLLNLQKMHKSTSYNKALGINAVNNLTKKYKFKGHLGDQDFFTLLSFEYKDLFYILPCTWNRQLCQWWKYHGYENVFNSYYKCDGKVHIYHGNCNTYLPD